MNERATHYLKARFYGGQMTGEELMRRVEAEVRRDIAAEMEQLRGERDETAKELSEAKNLVSERESRLANIKFLLEPIYGSTNYAPIGGTLDRVLDICDMSGPINPETPESETPASPEKTGSINPQTPESDEPQ